MATRKQVVLIQLKINGEWEDFTNELPLEAKEDLLSDRDMMNNLTVSTHEVRVVRRVITDYILEREDEE